ncbi:patatin-like phospholipase family protein [Labilibacter sediminis]|nr:patatin-like phospholipase family protein [Labilibacter sediminis]
MKQHQSNPATVKLFRNIGLTFSGGGYRAASFSLGVLSYLNHIKVNDKPLLQNVKGLSTVSGGTITGATFACAMAKQKSFKEYLNEYYKNLKEDQLLATALKNLSDEKIWKTSHKRRTLINAFALAYQELFTPDKFELIKNNSSQLQDICFNSTDFSFGLAFRFQNTGNFGNYRLKNTNLDLLANQMKIGDFIAASSCFPLGFEPIIMPDDFINEQQHPAYIAIKNQELYKKGIGLMDGGIVDNQGIGSIMKADERRKKDNKFDLIMVCDVGSYMMDPWESSELDVTKTHHGKSPKQIVIILGNKIKNTWWLFLPAALSPALFYLAYYYENCISYHIAGGAMASLTLVGIAIKICLAVLKKRALKLWDWVMNICPEFLKDKLHFFDNLKLRLVKRMTEERLSSSVKMINEIFLKQIRRLNYQLFYTDDKLKNRRVSTLIYELTQKQYKLNESDEKGEEKKSKLIPEPKDRIYAAAKIASEMGTTLWFNKEDTKVNRLKNMVACGQFTTCYNLLKYCIELKQSDADIDRTLLNEVSKTLMQDWKKFINDPYWLHDESIN